VSRTKLARPASKLYHVRASFDDPGVRGRFKSKCGKLVYARHSIHSNSVETFLNVGHKVCLECRRGEYRLEIEASRVL
jgi:hypothetical protein